MASRNNVSRLRSHDEMTLMNGSYPQRYDHVAVDHGSEVCQTVRCVRPV
jgi:hypothetical protein